MKVTDTSALNNSSLASVEIDNGVVKIILKNGSTFTLTPEVEEGVQVLYKMDYLTGKENKQIEKLQKKIQELESQVEQIKESDTSDDSDDNDSETEE